LDLICKVLDPHVEEIYNDLNARRASMPSYRKLEYALYDANEEDAGGGSMEELPQRQRQQGGGGGEAGHAKSVFDFVAPSQRRRWECAAGSSL
jgi:hypothetical protein